MQVVFIGVVNIGWQCLKALLESRAHIVGIFTADKRHMVETSGMHPDYFSDFDDIALKWSIPIHKVDTVGVPLDIEKIRALKPDFIVCIGWPQIVNREILKIPSSGCIGIHPTLLPERRGGAPINWCFIDGLSKSGVTLFYLDEGVDSGDIIAQREFEISFRDNARTVLNKVTEISVELLKANWAALESGKALRIPQDHSKATYTRRRRPEDGVIDWRLTSLSIYNWIRALSSPFPGAFTFFKGKRLIIWEAGLLKGYRAKFNAQPGEVLAIQDAQGMIVATGDNCILIKSLWFNGENMRGDEFMRRLAVIPSDLLK